MPKGFRQYLGEVFFEYVKYFEDVIEVYKNPAPSEIQAMIKACRKITRYESSFRFIIMVDSGVMYAWQGMGSMHQSMFNKLGLSGDRIFGLGKFVGGKLIVDPSGASISGVFTPKQEEIMQNNKILKQFKLEFPER